MSEIKTYPEMNETIKDLLRRSEEPMTRYVLARIEELERKVSSLTPPPNEPLTLDELREMDGEPAYFQFGDGTQGWCIVEKDVSGIILHGPDFDDHIYPDDDFINMEYNDPAGHFGLHVLGWRAYRRKPEEGTI